MALTERAHLLRSVREPAGEAPPPTGPPSAVGRSWNEIELKLAPPPSLFPSKFSRPRFPLRFISGGACDPAGFRAPQNSRLARRSYRRLGAARIAYRLLLLMSARWHSLFGCFRCLFDLSGENVSFLTYSLVNLQYPLNCVPIM